MKTEYELRQETQRGDAARALLDNPLLSECFDKLKQTYLDQLMQTNVTQGDLREKCWMAARVVDVVRDHLVTVVGTGTVAKSDLDQLAHEGERKRRFGIV